MSRATAQLHTCYHLSQVWVHCALNLLWRYLKQRPFNKTKSLGIYLVTFPSQLGPRPMTRSPIDGRQFIFGILFNVLYSTIYCRFWKGILELMGQQSYQFVINLYILPRCDNHGTNIWFIIHFRKWILVQFFVMHTSSISRVFFMWNSQSTITLRS